MSKKQENPIEALGQGIEDISQDIEKKVKKEWRIFKKFSHKNEDKLLFAAFVVLVCALFVVNTVYVVNRLPARQKVVYVSNTVVSPQTILTSSQHAQNDAIEVFISGVKEDSTADPAFAIVDTETHLIASVSIKNNTNTTQTLIPNAMFYVRSADGTIYRMHPYSGLKNPLVFQELAPSATAVGEVSFAIPKVLTSPLLYIDLGWNNYVPFVYDVLK